MLFEQLGQRRQIVDAGFAAGDHHMARGVTLLAHHRQQLLGAGIAPGVAFLCFDQDPLQVDFPIGFLFPGMFGIAPTAPYRAALQADKMAGTPVKKPSPCKVWNISLIGYCISFSIWKVKAIIADSGPPTKRPKLY